MSIKLFKNGKAFPAYRFKIKNLIKALWILYRQKADVLVIGDISSKTLEDKRIRLSPICENWE